MEDLLKGRYGCRGQVSSHEDTLRTRGGFESAVLTANFWNLFYVITFRSIDFLLYVKAPELQEL
jgi:hypothetical protein